MAKKAVATKLTTQGLERLINERYGAGTVRRASDPTLAVERIPCGILSIDVVLGGGFPRNRHVEIFGTYAVGKSYTVERLIASAQAEGLTCAYIDVEHTFDPRFAEHIGIDLEALTFHQQEYGNRVIDLMETLLRSELYDVIVLDSIAALLPRQELEQDMDAGTMGTAQAKLMSAALRRLTAANKRTVIVYINQTRDSIGSVFATRNITSGGRAMGFYAGVRLEMVRGESIKKKSRRINPASGVEQTADLIRGHRVLVKIVKDKTGGSQTQDVTTFVFDYEQAAIDHVEDLLYLGRANRLIHKRGNSWWLDDYEDEKQVGRAKFKTWLTRNVAVAEELETRIRELTLGGDHG